MDRANNNDANILNAWKELNCGGRSLQILLFGLKIPLLFLQIPCQIFWCNVDCKDYSNFFNNSGLFVQENCCDCAIKEIVINRKNNKEQNDIIIDEEPNSQDTMIVLMNQG